MDNDRVKIELTKLTHERTCRRERFVKSSIILIAFLDNYEMVYDSNELPMKNFCFLATLDVV
jgi:hypothetical protein